MLQMPVSVRKVNFQVLRRTNFDSNQFNQMEPASELASTHLQIMMIQSFDAPCTTEQNVSVVCVLLSCLKSRSCVPSWRMP